MNHYQISQNYRNKTLPSFLKWVMQNIDDPNIILFCKQFLQEVKKWIEYQRMSVLKGFLPGKGEVVEPDYYNFTNMENYSEKKSMLEQILGIDERYFMPDVKEKYEALEQIFSPVHDFMITDEGRFLVNGLQMEFVTEEELEQLKGYFPDIHAYQHNNYIILQTDDSRIRDTLSAIRNMYPLHENEHSLHHTVERMISINGVEEGPFTCHVTASGFEGIYSQELGGYIITDIPDTKKVIFPETIKDSNNQEFPVVKIGIDGMDSWTGQHPNFQTENIVIPKSIKELSLTHAFDHMPHLKQIQGLEHLQSVTSKDIAKDSMLINQITLSQNIRLKHIDCIPEHIHVRYVSEKEKEGYVDKEPEWKMYTNQILHTYDFTQEKAVEKEINPLNVHIVNQSDFVTNINGEKRTLQAVSLNSGFKAVFNDEMQGYTICELPMDERQTLVFPNTIVNADGKSFPVIAIGIEGASLCNEYMEATKMVIPENITCIDGKALQNLPELETITGFSHVKSLTGTVLSNSEKIQHMEVAPELAQSENIMSFFQDTQTNKKRQPVQKYPKAQYMYDEQMQTAFYYTDSNMRAIYDEASQGFYIYDADDSNPMLKIPEYLDINGNEIPVKGFCQNHNFINRNFTYLSIPDSITFIPDNFMLNCTSLMEIRGLEHITMISDNAFHNCTSLETYQLSDECYVSPAAFLRTKEKRVEEVVTIQEEEIEISEERADIFVPVENTQIVQETYIDTCINEYDYDTGEYLGSYSDDEYTEYSTVNRSFDDFDR